MRIIDGALLLAVMLPFRLDGQQRPPLDAVAGHWRLDPSRSDSGVELQPSYGPVGLVPRNAVLVRRDEVEGRSVVVSPAPRGTLVGPGPVGGLGDRPMPRPVDDPKLRPFRADLRAAAALSVAVKEAEVTITDDAGHASSWLVDAPRRQEAQMEGGVVEFEAKWNGKALVVQRTIPGALSVTREFRPSADGVLLQLKTTLRSSVSGKTERHFTYVRVEAAP